MRIIIHRGTHQIGGCATEIATDKTRIIIDMGEELSLDKAFVSAPLDIPGVTDADGHCDAVLFTHYHGDHTGQINLLHSKQIPVYLSTLTKDILTYSLKHTLEFLPRLPDENGVNARKCTQSEQSIEFLKDAIPFVHGSPLIIGDIRITPYHTDHSAIDSSMFLIEAEGKRILHTGDFRMSGYGKDELLATLKSIGHVDVVITEGTALYDAMHPKDTDAYDPNFLPAPQAETTHLERPQTEEDIQNTVVQLLDTYNYIFIMVPTTALDRVCGLSRATPQGTYFIVDKYQNELLDIVKAHSAPDDAFHSVLKLFTLHPRSFSSENGKKTLQKMRNQKVIAIVRNTKLFRDFIPTLCDTEERMAKSIMLYSMWDGYRRAIGNTINTFLAIAGTWAQLHTSGHATPEAIQTLLELTTPNTVIPIHTENPDMIKTYYPEKSTVILNDKEVFTL